MSNPLKKLQKRDQTPGINSNSERKRHPPITLILALILFVILFACAGSIALVEIWPSYGAQVANQIRNYVGPIAVARIENVVFQVQDTVKQRFYHYGVEQVKAPWSSSAIPPDLTPAVQTPQDMGSIPSEQGKFTHTPSVADKTPASMGQSGEPQGQMLIKTASITSTATPYIWQVSNLIPFGSLEGEGVWLPYLYDEKGNVVAERTFLQPDPERPYAIVAVVAFDLTRTRLHFVLGFLEPSLPGGPKGDGLIPEKDREAGTLLATFNGGFRSANGQFGAMADGIVALPPKSEIATVGIYRNGDIRIGNWGEDILDTPDLVSWRQNCRLIIHDGQISSRVYNNSITDWGASINNEIVTRRSGLGLDQGSKTLYYFAGPSLSMPTLADAMLAAGVHQGMLLDINNFWVLFSAIHSVESELVAEALLPNEMKDKIERYLGASPDDFFYVTAIKNH